MLLSHVVAFAIGMVAAGILVVGFVLSGKFGLKEVFTKKNGIENGLMLFAVALIIISVVYDFGIDEKVTSITSSVIGFIGSVWFSYLLTKKYSKVTYEEQLKEVASTAYRHNKSLLVKIKYEIELIERVFLKNKCQNRDGNSCENMHLIYRIRDSLIGFRRDTEENISDWSNIIAKEINLINAIIETRKESNEIKYKIADTEETTDLEVLHCQLEQMEEKLNESEEELNKSPIFKMILEKELSQEDEMIERIKIEEDIKISQSTKASHGDAGVNIYLKMNELREQGKK